MVRAFILTIFAVLSVACSTGNQTLYVATDRPEELTITINGKQQVQPTKAFQAYGSVKLTKGAEVIVESGGAELERVTLPEVEERENALFLVKGSPGLELVDYKKMFTVKDHQGRGGFNGTSPGWGPVTRAELDIMQVNRSLKTVTFDKRTVIVGPDDPLPKGGSVNQFTFDKFSVYRVERVPEGADPFGTIGPRVTRELGRDRLPGSGSR